MAWVGRERELATLAVSAGALRRGQGSVVWVEGESGIGKSALVIQALAEARDPAWDIRWGAAGPLSERLPLRVMQDCLGVRPRSDDPRRSRVAAVLRDGRLGLLAGGDTPTAGIEELLALVDKLCADAPVVIAIDDLQWADDASLIVFHELAALVGELPLLLIATCRPAPRRADVRELRAAVEHRGAAMVGLGPLPESDVASLVTKLLGAPPGNTLRRLTAQASGNPLYLRELISALVQDQEVRVGPDAAEVPAASERLPGALAAVLDDRLTSVSPETGEMLRTATLLGSEFGVSDLAVLLGKPASALSAAVREAVAVGILAGSGPDLSFRHPLVRQALYESMPEALRTALHAEGARELAARGADALSVARQLSMAGRLGAAWTRSWLEGAAPALTSRAPRLAVDLLRREVDEAAADGVQGGLMTGLVRALLAAGSYEEAASRASQMLREITDPARLAETYTVLARARVSGGQSDQAISALRQALSRADLPRMWRARMLAMLAMLERAATGDLDAAEVSARQALGIGQETGDAFATAHALAGLWLSHGVRRDHPAALACVDRAMRVLGDGPGYDDLRPFVLECRVFTLQNLSRWADAGQTLRQARVADRRGTGYGAWTSAAVHSYWMGRWNDALAELNPGDPGDVPGPARTYLREGWPALLVHGVTALIAGRRDQRTTAGRHLRQGLALPAARIPDRENRDFLVAAHALALEQSGDTRRAMGILAALVPRPEGEMTLTYQWLPDLVRLAVAAGDKHLARSAAQACEAESAAEVQPARAAAASLRCRGLLKSDPVPLRDTVAYYRETGPVVELPAALEDLAAVLAECGAEEEARAALNEAVTLYEGLGAHWDIRRADGRLRPFGIRRGARGPRGPRPAHGWDALTPTEIKVATLVGAGQSTSDIASSLFLSRRTVQKHISNILAKLGAKSRVEIVREVLHQGITA